MADYDQEEFDFDEDGIYREKFPDHTYDGIFVDEDGIWREEGDGPYTGRDSGLGTADRKSSSSTINRLPVEQSAPTPHQASVGGRRRDSYAERSLNISELEASDSGSYEQESIRSEDQLYLPELNDNDTDRDSEARGPYGVPRAPRNIEYDYESVHSHDNDEVFEWQEEVSDEVKDLAVYLTASHDAAALRNIPRDPVTSVGDSIFTQEDPEGLSQQGHSQLEFEHLEMLASDNQMDLINSYLKGIQEQEMMEDPSLQELHQKLRERQESLDKRAGKQQHHRQSRSHNSPTFDESMIENELPPFGVGDSINFSSLEMTAGSQEHKRKSLQDRPSTPQAWPSTSERPTTPSKIPMLQSRSPSMSRPGSAQSRSRSRVVSESRSRPHSAIGVRQDSDPKSDQSHPITPDRRRSPERRSLPASPQGSSRSNSQDRDSRSSSLGRVDGRGASVSPPRSRDKLSQGRSPGRSPGRSLPIPGARRSQEDSYSVVRRQSEEDTIHKAAELLLDARDASTPDTAATSGNDADLHTPRSRQSPRTQVKRSPSSSRKHTPSPAGTGKQRPFSAEVARPAPKPQLNRPGSGTPSTFKVRSHSISSGKPQPLKATINVADSTDVTRSSTDMEEGEETSITDSKSKNELKKKFLTEKKERKQKEQTLIHLQQEYHTLLQKYAEAENTIDSLRIGAKIPISIELTATGQERRLSMASVGLPANHRGSVVSLVSAPATAAVGIARSRPTSSMSTASMHFKTGAASAADIRPELTAEDIDMQSLLGTEGVKLSLLAKAKAVEEQTSAFEVLLREERLTLDEQEQALGNVKSGYENLQQTFRDAKDEYLLKKRQRGGSVSSSDTGFDDDKTLEGELYKIGMKLDKLESNVQENLKGKHMRRKPFQGPTPVKGDHRIGRGSIAGGSIAGSVVSGRHQPQGGSSIASSKLGSATSLVGELFNQGTSFGGGSSDIEDKLEQMNQEYSELMQHYHRLKQMDPTPQRDASINHLLDELRDIYNSAPECKKPELPVELHYLYDSKKEPPLQLPQPEAYNTDSAKMEENNIVESDLSSQQTNGYYSSSITSSRDRPKDTNSDRQSDRRSDRYSSRNSNSSYSRRPSDSRSGSARRSLDYRQGREFSQGSASDSTVSVPRPSSVSKPGRQGAYGHLSNRPSSHSKPPGRRDNLDKDSGYVGSETSRKTAIKLDNNRIQPGLSLHQSKRNLGSRSTVGQSLDSDVSSQSEGSTVEHVKPYRPPSTYSSAKSPRHSNEATTTSKPATLPRADSGSLYKEKATPSHRDSLPSQHKDSAPISCQRDSIPGSRHRDSIPGSHHRDSISDSRHRDSIPGSRHRESIPGSRHRESIPGSRHRDSIPGISHRDSIPGSRHRDSISGSDEESFISRATTGFSAKSPSVKSEQLQTLKDEVDKLKSALKDKVKPKMKPALPSQKLDSDEDEVDGVVPKVAAPGNNTPYGQQLYYHPQYGYFMYGDAKENQPPPVNQPAVSSFPEQIYAKVPYNEIPQQPLYTQAIPEVSPYQDHSHVGYPQHKYYSQPAPQYYESPKAHWKPRPMSYHGRHEGKHGYSDREVSPKRYGGRNDRLYNSDDDRKTDRLRDYYIPGRHQQQEKSKDYKNPHRRYKSHSDLRTYGNTYEYTDGYYPYAAGYTSYTAGYNVSPAGYTQPPTYTQITGYAPPAGQSLQASPYHPQTNGYSAQLNNTQPNVPNVLNTTYNAVPNAYSNQGPVCPSCGLQSKHSHEYSHNVQPASSIATLQPQNQHVTPQAALPIAASSVVTVPSTRHSPTKPQPVTAYIPVQVLPADSSYVKVNEKVKGRQGHKVKGDAKVRYYVREYADKESKIKTSKSNRRSSRKVKKSSRKNHQYSSEEDSSQSEVDLNSSLECALETAEELKKMSSSMRSSLKGELSRSAKYSGFL